tara:strand:- start:32 stop:331 length:300 start_codon:yes stop_codon:yes gene_type:complete
MEEIIFTNGDKTSDIDDCSNNGCGFNKEGICEDSGTECFGYFKGGDDIVLRSKILVTCGHPLANIGEAVFAQETSILDRNNSFRCGSRGKGGKVKYMRK